MCDALKIIDERISELKKVRLKLRSEKAGAWTRKRKASRIFCGIQELVRLRKILQGGDST